MLYPENKHLGATVRRKYEVNIQNVTQIRDYTKMSCRSMVLLFKLRLSERENTCLVEG